MAITSEHIESYLGQITRRDGDLAKLVGSSPGQLALSIAHLLPTMAFLPGQVILNQGDESRHMYLLVTGAAAVDQVSERQPSAISRAVAGPPPEGLVSEVNRIMPPDVVGEVAAVLKRSRIATVRATEQSTCLVVDKDTLRSLLHVSPPLCAALLLWAGQNVVERIERTISHSPKAGPFAGLSAPSSQDPVETPSPEYEQGRTRRHYLTTGDPKRNMEDKAARVTLKTALESLTGIDWLGVPDLVPDSLATAFDLFHVKDNDPIVSDGERGDSLLLMVKGRASLRDAQGHVLRTFEGAAPRCERLFIGELAFLRRGARRQGTVVAEGQCKVLELTRQAHLRLLTSPPGPTGEGTLLSYFAVNLAYAMLRTASIKLMTVSQDKIVALNIAQEDYAYWFKDE